MKKTEKSKKPNVFKTFIKLLPMIFAATPFLFIMSLLISILHGISWGIITLFTQKFFDSATQLVDKKTTYNGREYQLQEASSGNTTLLS